MKIALIWGTAIAFGLVAYGLNQVVPEIPEPEPEPITAESRSLYALAMAAPEYCPNIERKSFVRAATGYRFETDNDAEMVMLAAAKRQWFDTFKAAGSRHLACEQIMRQFGPGANLQMFEWD